MTDIKLTGTIAAKQTGKNEQVLDKLKVERERGITGSFLCLVSFLLRLTSGGIQSKLKRLGLWDSH